MSREEVFIAAAARTPIGAFQGALSGASATQLGAAAIAGALERAGVEPGAIDEVYMGQVLSAGAGQAPARQAALAAGIPHAVPATGVSKVCGSGLQAVILGSRAIALGDAQRVVAGGMESMSNAPYALPRARAGYRMGHGQVLDLMIHDGLWDPYGDMHMGHAGELCAREYGIGREAQDAFAHESYRRAQDAREAGLSAHEIVPVTLKERRGERRVEHDEEPERARLDRLPSLPPAFDADGTITAANASKIDDGAAAVVLASAEAVREGGLQPLARIVSYGHHAQAPEWFTTAPVGAIERALARAGLGRDEVGLYEINEAFAVVTLACTQLAELDPERVNVRGGAVALGHPIGASGARILTTLLYAMHERTTRYGLATLCIGGGEAVAVVVERA
ncbi:MAG: thiolase family protein [Myxococcales bacterium]|nr:thiolase family protein [Myxococcales bacterium]